MCGNVTHASCSTSVLSSPCESGRVSTEVLQRRLASATTRSSPRLHELSENFNPAEQAAPDFILNCIETIELLAHRNASQDLYALYSAKVQPAEDEVDRIAATLEKGEFDGFFLRICFSVSSTELTQAKYLPVAVIQPVHWKLTIGY